MAFNPSFEEYEQMLRDDMSRTFPSLRDKVIKDSLVIKNAVNKKKGESDNNGGSTDYYKIPNDYTDLQDKIEGDDFNFSQGNILKSAWTLGKGRHEGTGYERELNKIIFFAQRELDRL